MGYASDRAKEKNITIPEGWEVVEHKEVKHKLKEEYSLYNWRDKEFRSFQYWVDKGEVNAETMEYTDGMIAIRQLPIKEPIIIPTKPIKRMDKSSFLNTIKNFK